MTRLIQFTVLLLWGAIPTSLTAQAAAVTEVAPGVTWRQDVNPSGPTTYNVLQIDMSDPRVSVEAESAQDKLFAGESVLTTAKREAVPGGGDVVAAVNGDFWSNTPRPFSPIGLLVADGMIYNMPARNRSAFALTKDKQPYIGVVTLKVSLTGDFGSIQVDRINSGTRSDENIVLFTPPYGAAVEPAAGKRFILKLAAGTEFLPNQPVEVQLGLADSETSTALDAATLVLHVPAAKTKSLPALSDNARLILSAKMPEVDGVVASVCGGGPALIGNGQIKTAAEGLSREFAAQRSPRTALGYTKDGKTLYLVTVDGRQPRHSIGASLQEMGQYMLNLGCYNAINLDGGGSTTMVVSDKIVNKPSNLFGAEVVASSLLVVIH